MRSKTIFTYDDDVAGLVDDVHKLFVIGLLAGLIEQHIQSDDFWLGLIDFGDHICEKHARETSCVISGKRVFVEIDEDNILTGSLFFLKLNEQVIARHIWICK